MTVMSALFAPFDYQEQKELGCLVANCYLPLLILIDWNFVAVVVVVAIFDFDWLNMARNSKKQAVVGRCSPWC